MIFILIIPLLLIHLLRLYLANRKNRFKSTFEPNGSEQKLVAFFHPYCNAGGGGERVLWSAILALQRKYPDLNYVIYSDKYDVDDGEIIRKAKQTFQIDLNISVRFIKLNSCFLLSPKLYPIFTLLGQNLGSMLVGIEALFKCPPDIVCDTMGASFIYPLFRLFGQSSVCAYVHYPIISTDMLDIVERNMSTYNNRQMIAKSALLTKSKLYYYKIFSFIYKLTGKCADVIMVNSTWTKNHINQIWDTNASVVYPPCNTDNLKQLNITNKNPNLIISISQFRPEKNHFWQLESVKKLVQLIDENNFKVKPKLVMIGSCRNSDDEKLVQDLEDKVKELKIENFVTFKKNIDYNEMVKFIEESSVAIHTMKNEHFGISVVEFLAAGLLTLTHNSGGPKIDIIQENVTGFLASDVDEFANHLLKLINLSEKDSMAIRTKARESIDKFSQESFEKSFIDKVHKIFST